MFPALQTELLGSVLLGPHCFKYDCGWQDWATARESFSWTSLEARKRFMRPLRLNFPGSLVEEGHPDTYEFDELDPSEGWAELSHGKRVISLAKSGGARTLHQIGSCWRIPALQFRKFEFLEEEEKGGYHRLRKDCFPKQRDPLEEVIESSDTGSSDSSSSSESDS